jgi:predicted nucleic acid-binding protein
VSVIVDTSVWSLALRRTAPRDGQAERELRALVGEGRVVVIGPVRQELLSGVRSPEQFKLLRDRLRAFPDLRLRASDYEDAADCFNRCRARGIQGSNTDFLLCAVSLARALPIFTTDEDFSRYAEVLRVKLHLPRA